MPAADGDQMLCGWRVASALPLPELPPWAGAGIPAQVTIRLGEVPERLEAPVHDGPLLQIDGNGFCRYAIAGVAAYGVDPPGTVVTVAPAMDPTAPDIRLFLLGTVLGLLCFKRGLLPLHAACVEIDGRAVAFAGPSGVGKSTLAAALNQRGHRLLADDVTAVDLSDGAVARPGLHRQKLWRDSLDALGLAAGERLRIRAEDMEKFEHPADQAFQPAPLPLAAVCHLREAALPGRPAVERLSALDAVKAARANTYRRVAGGALLGEAGLFQAAATLASRVPQVVLERPRRFADLPEFLDRLPELLRGVRA